MISIYNLTKLHSLLQDFYNITKIRITVFDDNFKEIAAYPNELPTFCKLIRSNSIGLNKCIECDNNACLTVKHSKNLYTYRCHAGLTESILPITMGNIVIGYLFFGHVFSYTTFKEGIEHVKYCCKDLNIDLKILESACNKQTITSMDYIISSSHIMETVASYLCLERIMSFKQTDISIKIDEYIHENIDKEINVSSIASNFKIGKTKLYKLAKENYGVGIAEQIRILRIEKAKTLLLENTLTLAEISSQCGFCDYNYFISVFKREVGVSPKKFYKSIAKDVY